MIHNQRLAQCVSRVQILLTVCSESAGNLAREAALRDLRVRLRVLLSGRRRRRCGVRRKLLAGSLHRDKGGVGGSRS
jgi:hypothetical protein